MIILCMSAHGYHGIRPHIRRARITPYSCKTFGWPAVRKRTCISYTMLQTASTVHTGPGAPTCHVARCDFDTERHPVSLSDHARAISGETRPYVNVYAVYTALPTFRGFSGTLSTLPSLVRIGLCAFPILGHACPIGRRVLYDGVLPGRYNVH